MRCFISSAASKSKRDVDTLWGASVSASNLMVNHPIDFMTGNKCQPRGGARGKGITTVRQDMSGDRSVDVEMFIGKGEMFDLLQSNTDRKL